MAKKFPNSKITAVSNSATQRQFIEAEAKKRNLHNVKIITRNVATLEMQDTFDRIISVEMFEHMRNYKKLLNNISSWLKPDGKLFVHIFVHKDMTYTFDVKDESDWMSKYFFSGGIMPSEHLLYYFSEDMVVGKHWVVNGTHYAKTARAWLENTDKNKDKIISLFEKHYGKTEAHKWFHYWRVFFLSCEELWNYKNGEEWFVGHYLLSPRKH
jgi:cyclopropane-fatty-acyl-phospholipid synthase